MTQEVFLLSYTKYGDHDAVLHCFCRENGFESFFAKGIYAPKNKKKAFLFPLNELSIGSEKMQFLKMHILTFHPQARQEYWPLFESYFTKKYDRKLSKAIQ